MSDLQNPIFDNEKEFLERQRQEYKNALLGDVAVIKDSSAEIGKKVLLAGGALAGVWLASRLLFGKKKKKKKQKKEARRLLESRNAVSHNIPLYLKPEMPQETLYTAPDEVEFGSPLDFNQPYDDANPAYYNTPAKYFDPERHIEKQLPQVESPMPQGNPGNYSLHSHYHAAPEIPAESSHPAPGIAAELLKAMATQVTAFLLVYLSKKAEEFLLKNADIAQNAPETTDADFSYDADAGKQYL
jgi:hypothetical protein